MNIQEQNQVIEVALSRGYINEYEEVMYMYNEEGSGLCGVLTIIDYIEFASISAVRAEIEDQLILIQKENKSEDEMIIEEIEPWNNDGIIVCKEGAFVWDSVILDYVWCGELIRTVRSQMVQVVEDVTIDYGYEEIQLTKGEEYTLENQYVFYEEDNFPVIMLVMKKEDSAPIVLPYDKSVLTINNRDFAILNYTSSTTI